MREGTMNIMESENDNVLLRQLVPGADGRGALVGQVITAKEICDMIPRSGNPKIDPLLTVATIQGWLTNPNAHDPVLGSMRMATRELAHELAKRRFATSRDY
jgi:hypothetical protein